MIVAALLRPLFLLAQVVLVICVASSGSSGSYHIEQTFSSSIVTHDEHDDIALGLLHKKHINTPPIIDNHGIKLHRSFIDRDPIYYEDIGQNSIDASEVDTSFDDILMHQRRTSQQSHHNRWQSPLESISPLPTLSLDDTSRRIDITHHPQQQITISPCPRHSHEIDIHQNNNQPTTMKLKTRKTGTTITALLAQNSTVVILAADTRATDGSTVADKRCEKLHTLARNVWCAGAGTSADVDALVRRVKYTFWKRSLVSTEEYGGVGNMMDRSYGRSTHNNNWGLMDTMISNEEDRNVPSASVPAILHYIRTRLQKTRGNLGVNLLVGGYDYTSDQAHLTAVHPHGSIDVVTYAALGSGGLAATGVLESRYPRIGNGQCTIREGIQLAVDAVRAGIDNDLGSGSQVDVCVISREGVFYRRAVVREEELEWVVLSPTNDDEVSSKNDEQTLSQSIMRDQKSESSSGVNGFGNVPFAIQSKKLVSGGQSDVERDRRRWLDEVLGGEK